MNDTFTLGTLYGIALLSAELLNSGTLDETTQRTISRLLKMELASVYAWEVCK